MIAHRATVFEQNSAIWAAKHVRERVRGGSPPETIMPAGHRATWADRGRLGVAKLADRLQPGQDATAIAPILFEPGHSGGDDEFIEVHIWGPMTRRTIEAVAIKPEQPGLRTVREKMLEHRLQSVRVAVRFLE
jgi:hypothetical protein